MGPGDACGWYFLDVTKRGNRRWCSMSDCGQDAKVARRRATRTRDLAGPPVTRQTGSGGATAGRSGGSGPATWPARADSSDSPGESG
ncbi:MAG: CGNR zinc finger domain-containing protein [Streptosporangiaceae bacterium]